VTTTILTKIEALCFANLLMSNRNFCEIARNRVLLEIRNLVEPIEENKVVEIVIGRR
jgi:hypothetical protein